TQAWFDGADSVPWAGWVSTENVSSQLSGSDAGSVTTTAVSCAVVAEVDAAVGAWSAGATPGVRATRAPTFSWATVAVAVLVPGAPGVAWVKSEPSQGTRLEPAVELASPRSVMPVGGVIEFAPPTEKKPTTSAPATVVVTDGATIAVVLEFWPAPADTLTGAALFTPW